jgi:hypothetical protein
VAPEVDNTARENKNGYLLLFYSWLVSVGRCKSVTCHYFRSAHGFLKHPVSHRSFIGVILAANVDFMVT